jgi:hypothetical protein
LDGVGTGTIDAGTTLVGTDEVAGVGAGADVGVVSSVELVSCSWWLGVFARSGVLVTTRMALAGCVSLLPATTKAPLMSATATTAPSTPHAMTPRVRRMRAP